MVKKQLEKIQKIDKNIYEIMYEQFKQIDTVKEKQDLDRLKNSLEIIQKGLAEDKINTRLSMNLFKSILSKNYFGQPSFLNVLKNAYSFEEQVQLMEKDYVSNIVQTGFLNDILDNAYTMEEIEEELKKRQETNLTDKVSKIFRAIERKFISKNGKLEQLQEYIQETVLDSCHMCENKNILTNQYTEANFVPIAVSNDNMKNFFWNENTKFPICDMCKLLLFCIPAGITPITKIIKENQTYKEKEVMSFLNYDTSVSQLLQQNNNFTNIAKQRNSQHHPYQEMLLNIVEQEKKISNWQLSNIFVIEFEAEYQAYSRMEYFDMKPYIAIFLRKYASSSLSLITDYRYKTKILDHILKNKDTKSVITERLYDCMTHQTSGYYCYLATKTRMIVYKLKKGGKNMEEQIDKCNKKLYALYKIGMDIRKEFIKQNSENKLETYVYQLLNSIKTGNKEQFMYLINRLHLTMKKDVSPIFIEIQKEQNLDFSSIGQTFVSGLISKEYQGEKREVTINE